MVRNTWTIFGSNCVPAQRRISSRACDIGRAIAIVAVAQHGIESIGDGDDACPERNLFTAQATWIARTIEVLMVSQDDVSSISQERNASEHVIANLAVGADDLLFGVVERAGFAKNLAGDSHLADIVKKSAASQHGEIRERNGNALGNGNGVGSDALGVAKCFHVFKVESAAESFEGVVVRLRQKIQGVGQLRRFSLDLLLQVDLVILVFGDELAVLPGASDGMEELVLLEGFQDVVISAAANSLESSGDVVDRRNHDDGNFRVVTAEPIEQLDAVYFWQDQIEEDKVRRLLADKFLSVAPVANGRTAIAARF